ncbi:uncharacterized protein K452DRAFT_302623 [Aplosporella prunicola CBS 121167]|uniref:EGF-like domain-containing protein n=1 Tax=Aplosporella prunicola CBS 121167 TaxID=1176127 RepID=A0A6A6AXW0_9PEZI|nr:uncharacterized protein K452DRAFT_302623 [Aplosporella prunicola CBS 121167]KAF2136610.1 hypothetical protein K452DRAFT_302623 [Aplosporella prunicola CBS 121167]
MKTLSYLAVFLASTAFASAITAPSEAVQAAEDAEASINTGTCDQQSQICTYKIHGTNHKCHCGQPSGDQCTSDRNICHWNINTHPDRCNCS